MNTLEQLGFTHYKTRVPGLTDIPSGHIGRISTEFGTRYTIISNTGEHDAIATKTFITGRAIADRPKVGDWAVFEEIPGDTKVKITSLLPRFSSLSRKHVGKKLEAQVIGANVDTVCIVESIATPFDANRIERFLTVPEVSNTSALLILTKADAVSSKDKEIFLKACKERLSRLSVLVTSIKTGEGIAELKETISTGETLVLIGPSGVGKSSLINTLIGSEVLGTGAVRENDNKGRHTTTVRQLLVLPSGGIIIDTPGMRELQLWGDSATELSMAFADIEELISQCRFTNCDHVKSQGCALRRGVEDGTIAEERYESFLKLKRELEHHHSKSNYESKLAKQKREKKAAQNLRIIVRHKRGKKR